MPIMRHVTVTCKLILLIWHCKHAPLEGINDHNRLEVDVSRSVYYLNHFESHVVWNESRIKIDAQFMDIVIEFASNRNDKDAKGPRIRDNHDPPPPNAHAEINFVSLIELAINIRGRFYHIPQHYYHERHVLQSLCSFTLGSKTKQTLKSSNP